MNAPRLIISAALDDTDQVTAGTAVVDVHALALYPHADKVDADAVRKAANALVRNLLLDRQDVAYVDLDGRARADVARTGRFCNAAVLTAERGE